MIPGVPPGYQWSVATEVVDVFSDVLNVVLNVVFWDEVGGLKQTPYPAARVKRKKKELGTKVGVIDQII